MVSGIGNIEYGKEVGSLTAGCEHAGRTAFKGCYFCRHHVVGGILETGIKISRILQVKQAAHGLTAVVLIGSTLDNRDHPRLSVLRGITGYDTFRFLLHTMAPHLSFFSIVP